MREISLNWNPSSPQLFEAIGPNDIKLSLDSPVSSGGEGRGFSPKVLLMLAVGGCTGMDVISMLRKMRQEVTDYQLEVKGWERTEHPKKFDRIVVEHVLTGRNLNQESVARAVKLSHEKYCGVSASLEGSVEIEMTYRLVEAAEEAKREEKVGGD
jgi:putative redox protein